MTLTQWLLLCAIFTAYLLLGGTIFMILEEEPGALEQVKLTTLRRDIEEILFQMDTKLYKNDTPTESLHLLRVAKENILARVSQTACGGTSLLLTLSGEGDPSSEDMRWDFYNSVIYGFTIVTTIGYGHLTPRSDWSRCAAVLYGLIGIPLNGILLSTLGDYFSNKLIKVFRQSKDDKVRLIFGLTFYLFPGTIIFIVFPSLIFDGMEKWTFTESLYFACISLMTVGFGDFVPGKEAGESGGLWIYKIFIIVWIQFGLGYLFMVLSFITKGLRHKKVRIVIEKRIKAMNTTKEQLLKDLEDMRLVMEDPFIQKMRSEMYHHNESQFLNDDDADDAGEKEKLKNLDPNGNDSIFSLYDHLRRRSMVIKGGGHFENDQNDTQMMIHNELMAVMMTRVVNDVMDVMEAVDDMKDFDEDENFVAPLMRRHKKCPANPTLPIVGQVTPALARKCGPSPSRKNSDALKDVVIHKKESWSTNVMDRVNTAIRKISRDSMKGKIIVVGHQKLGPTPSSPAMIENLTNKKGGDNKKLQIGKEPVVARQRKLTDDGATMMMGTSFSSAAPTDKPQRRKSIPPNFHRRLSPPTAAVAQSLEEIVVKMKMVGPFGSGSRIEVIGGGPQNELEIGGYHFRGEANDNESAGGTRHRRVGVLHHDWSAVAAAAAAGADF